jgi:hypothetical protein
MAPAMADTLILGDLNLTPDSSWRRGAAEDEADADSFILRAAAPALPFDVFLPRQRTRLKIDEAKFYEQLEANWLRRHGRHARLDWLDAGGARWRLCRRPSLTGDNLVFQAVSVHDGEAYHLVAVVAKGTEHLPESVRTLLAGATWGQDKSIADRAEAPAAVVPGARWRLSRKLVALPSGLDWVALADAERALLDGDGLVTGLGLSAAEDGLEAMLEGFLWKQGEGGEYRRAFRRNWRVLWPSLPERGLGGVAPSLDLDFHMAASGADAPGEVMVRFELRPLCASPMEVERWLDDLELEGTGPLARLDAMGCALEEVPEPVTVVAVANEAAAVADALVSRHVAMPLPSDWERAIRTPTPVGAHRLVLVARFMTSEAGHAPGDALLRRAAAVFVFEPDV